MPICEADPWREQYFTDAACPVDVRIPTEDCDAWRWYPKHRHVYDKIAVAFSQGLIAAPHGVLPPKFPVFSKPIINLKGMGVGSRVLRTRAEYEKARSHVDDAARRATFEHGRCDRGRGAVLVAPRHRRAGGGRHIR
jgi:hypothetical protein